MDLSGAIGQNVTARKNEVVRIQSFSRPINRVTGPMIRTTLGRPTRTKPRDLSPNPKFQLQSWNQNMKRARPKTNRHLASLVTLAALALLAMLILPSAHAQAQTKPASTGEIVASVNNAVITLAEYQKAEQQLRDEVTHDCLGCPPEKIDAQFKTQQKDLLRGLIDQVLMVQRAKDMGISVESDLNKRLDEIRKQNGLATLADLQKGVESSGLTWEDYKTTLRNSLLQKEVVRREVGAHLEISGDEVKQYYESHPQEFALPERVILSEISLSTEGKTTSDEFDAVRKKVEGLRSSVLNGDDFNQVAAMYSQGSTAKDGGNLGTFKKGELAPQIEAIVFQLGKGQITDVIQTRTGFEFLKVEDHVQAETQPMDKVETQIRDTLYAQKMQPRMREYLAELREQSYVTVKPGYTDSALLTGN
jgi:peptidyl-prolyl cis-trans isomerase SurA